MEMIKNGKTSTQTMSHNKIRNRPLNKHVLFVYIFQMLT